MSSPQSLDRDALIALVKLIMAGEGRTQEEADELVETFRANVPHPEADDLIFYPAHHFDDEPTAEEIVDRAMSYRSIQL